MGKNKQNDDEVVEEKSLVVNDTMVINEEPEAQPVVVDESVRPEAPNEDELLANKLASSVRDMEDQLAIMLQTADQDIYDEESEARKSPLAMVFEIMGCAFATPRFIEGKAIPEYDFNEHGCVRGYSQPCNDCRDCTYARYYRYGANLPVYERRYADHGVVVPLTEEQADSIADMMKAIKVKPLKRTQVRVRVLQQAIADGKAREAFARSRAIEAQQKGERPTLN